VANLQGKSNAQIQNDFETSVGEIKLVAMEAFETTSFDYHKIPEIDGNARNHAFRIADKIQDEAHKFGLFRRKNIIKNRLLELNRQNTYSFTGYMITTSDSQSVLGDIEDCISFEVLKHMLICLLKQAEDCGLGDSFQYKKLKKEYSLLIKEGGSSLKRKVNKKLVKETNIHIENLYMEMYKILH